MHVLSMARPGKKTDGLLASVENLWWDPIKIQTRVGLDRWLSD